MTSPTLRELVDMLPGEVGAKCQSIYGFASAMVITESFVADAILGYLVRWLGERTASIAPMPTGWEYIDHKGDCSKVEYPTPIEAAVRAVVAIEDAK